MAITWNNEYYISLEGRDLQANAMAVDNSGTYVLLAGYVWKLAELYLSLCCKNSCKIELFLFTMWYATIQTHRNFHSILRRRYIAIRNLDEVLEVVQKFPRQSKYDVGAAEWNPTPHKRELCVISVRALNPKITNFSVFF